jgi:hypothetical protein
MNDEKIQLQPKQNQEPEKPLCSCMTDPFNNLPPELRPRPKDVMSGLRKVTCPACGLSFWTNRDTDLCIECEKKGVHLPGI